jgi:tyrosinase
VGRHTLTNTEKKAYIDAELCLMKKPSNLKLRGARTKFDELQSVHVLAAEIAHFTVRGPDAQKAD